MPYFYNNQSSSPSNIKTVKLDGLLKSPKEASDGSCKIDIDGSYDIVIQNGGKDHWFRGAFYGVVYIQPMVSDGCCDCEISKPDDQKQSHEHGSSKTECPLLGYLTITHGACSNEIQGDEEEQSDEHGSDEKVFQFAANVKVTPNDGFDDIELPLEVKFCVPVEYLKPRQRFKRAFPSLSCFNNPKCLELNQGTTV